MSEYYLNETVVTFPGNIIQDSTTGKDHQKFTFCTK